MHLERALAIATAGRGSTVQHVATLVELGTLERERGRHAAARERYGEAQALLASGPGLDHPFAAGLFDQLGTLAYLEGRYEEALEHHGRSQALLGRAYGAENTKSATVLCNMSVDASALGREDEAIAYAQKALVIIEAALGPDHELASLPHNMLTNIHLDHGNYTEGIVHAQRVVDLSMRYLGDAHIDTGGAYVNLCAVQLALHRAEAARESCERGVEIVERAAGRGHPALAIAKGGLGRTLLELGDVTGARTQLEDAVRIAEATEAGPAELALARFDLARALWADPPEHARARAVAEQAQKDGDAIDGAYGESVRREIGDLLAQHRGTRRSAGHSR